MAALAKNNKKPVVRWRGGVPVKAYYEAARRDTQRKQRRETGSGNSAILRAGPSLHEQARHLDQNHDLATGALNTLVQNIVGANGIGIEPQPLTTSGSIHEEFTRDIHRVLENWYEHPEVTWQHDWASVQRLLCRTWMRDGEVLNQMLPGIIPGLDHGSRVPYSIEMIEPDFLPLDFNRETDPRIVGGIEVNAWGRPRAYHVYKKHPGESLVYSGHSDLKRVSADRILHLKHIKRIGQLRGESVFSTVLLRLDDIKDYEESERIAAKVAASMAAYIKKGSPEGYSTGDEDGDGVDDPRQLKFRAGMIFDDLQEGEEIGTIDTTRPNTGLQDFRNGQLRAGAAGMYLTYSSLSKDYNGTYSAQRQELVEGYGAYGMLASEFIGGIVRPNYHQILEMALLSGELVLPKEIDLRSLGDALYIPPQMPWIDPLKEAKAWEVLEENRHASAPEIIRKRGAKPRDVLDQTEHWNKQLEDKKLIPKQDGETAQAKARRLSGRPTDQLQLKLLTEDE